MSDVTPTDPTTTDPTAPPAPDPTKPKGKAKPEDLTTMVFTGQPYTGTLMVGEDSFVVTDGKVSVPERAIAGAMIAGFR